MALRRCRSYSCPVREIIRIGLEGNSFNLNYFIDLTRVWGTTFISYREYISFCNKCGRKAYSAIDMCMECSQEILRGETYVF